MKYAGPFRAITLPFPNPSKCLTAARVRGRLEFENI